MIKKVLTFIKREGTFPLFVKVLDRFFIPFGISFLTYLKLKDSSIETNPFVKKKFNNKQIFSKIYKNAYWQSGESKSGSGSDLDNLKNYNINLDNFFEKYQIKSMLDIPCGDFLFMEKFLKNKNIKYTGGDIVEELIQNNKKKYKNYKFEVFDIINNHKNEKFDVLHVKDCLFHFSFNDIWKVIENISSFQTKYTLITSHKSLIMKNLDIESGEFRHLDLEKKPFNFPKPIYKIYEYKFNITLFPRFVGVWKTKDLKNYFN